MSRTIDIAKAVCIVYMVAVFLRNTGRVMKAIELCQECLIALNSRVLIKDTQLANLLFHTIYMVMINSYEALHEHTIAEKYLRKLLLSQNQTSDDTVNKGWLNLRLARTLRAQNNLLEARKFYESAIKIMKTNDNTQIVWLCYEEMGTLLHSIGEYDQCKSYLEKGLALSMDICDRHGEAISCANLGTLFQSLGKYDKAREYQEKALAIRREIRDRKGEATSYENLGTTFQSLGKYDKARECQEKALAIRREIGDKKGEATSYRKLGILSYSIENIRRPENVTRKH